MVAGAASTLPRMSKLPAWVLEQLPVTLPEIVITIDLQLPLSAPDNVADQPPKRIVDLLPGKRSAS